MNTEVPLSLKITPVGRYTPEIYICYNCRWQPEDHCIVPYALGFFDFCNETMIVWKCPNCFKKQFFHAHLQQARKYNYLNMVDAFKMGNQHWEEAGADENYVLQHK